MLRNFCFSQAEAKAIADEIKAQGFLECSALKNENVTEIFQKAAILAMAKKRPEPQCCCSISWRASGGSNKLYFVISELDILHGREWKTVEIETKN